MTTSLSKIAVCAILLPVCLLSTYALTTRTGSGSTIDTFPAYTTVHHQTFTAANGSATRGTYWTSAVRSDGSRSTLIQYPLDSESPTLPVRTSRYIDFANGERFLVEDSLQSYARLSDYPRHSKPARWHRSPGSTCRLSFAGSEIHSRGESFLGTGEVGGLRTAVIQAGAITAQFAVDHGCALASLRVTHRLGIAEKSLLSLEEGDPEPQLFEIPKGYHRLSEQQLLTKVGAAFSSGSYCQPSDLIPSK